MKIYQSPSFEKKVKKLTPTEKKELDNVIRKIIQDPSIGQEKKIKQHLFCKFIIRSLDLLQS